VHEHSEPFEGIPVVDLFSEEEDTFPDTLRGEELARQLFGDLNRGLLGRPETVTSSSSVTLMKKRRCMRKTSLMPKPRHLLL
jgi:hypothetical protein